MYGGTATTRVFSGEQGESELIVSVSGGFSAPVRWKPRPSLDRETDSCWLHQDDLLVTDGRCQDENLHSTDPKLHGERVNIIFRWLKNHLPQCPLGAGVVCCLPTCVRGSSVPVTAGLEWQVWELGVIPKFLLGWGTLLLAALVLVGLWQRKRVEFWVGLWYSSQDVRLSCSHARALLGDLDWPLESSGGFWGFWIFCNNTHVMLCTLAKIRLPSLFSDDTCMVLKHHGALGRTPGR